ncbi:helix-turn-helix transcriptional regulator [Modestobacter marinus]|uniref:helix-turn-helix transcriptional regulator n=1 Tax=Modestobacter marinus TaxID=477641 RepID=UPI001C965EC5|nr:response regulator transcription factor [Modestobacter marinus]
MTTTPGHHPRTLHLPTGETVTILASGRDTGGEPTDLRSAIRVVAAGESLLSPAVTGTVLRSLADRLRATVDDAPLQGLTEREREVLALVGRGRSNEEIARELFLSPATARTYVSRLLAKLGARDRARLVVLAYETGLVVPGT